MAAYRYVRKSTQDGDPPEHADVTFVTEGNRDVLDESMAKMGFAFSHVIETPPARTPSFAFPGALAEGAAVAFEDRETPTNPRRIGELVPSNDGGGRNAPGGPTRDDAEEATDRALAALRSRGVLSGKDALSVALGDATSGARVLPTSPLGNGPLTLARAAQVTEQFSRRAARGMATAWSRTPPSAVLSLALLAAFIVHAKVVQSGFLDDDFQRFFDVRALRPWTFLSERFDGHYLGFYELGWLVCQKVLGASPSWFFALVFVSHAITVALVYGVARALSGRTVVGAIAAGLWGMTPAFQNTLLSLGSFGTVLCAAAMAYALREIALAAEGYRPLTLGAVVRTNVALLVCSGTMPGAWVVAAVFPLVAFLVLPRESSRGKSALFLLPSALAAAAPAVAFFKDAAAALPHPFLVVRTLIEFAAYGIGISVAGPLCTLHADGRGVGFFSSGAASSVAVIFSSVVAIAAMALLVLRAIRAPEERRELLGLVLLGTTLYLAVVLARGDLLSSRSAEYLATRAPEHYAANLPFVVALAAAARALRLRVEWLSRWRLAAVVAGGVVLVLLNASVSKDAHAMRPERSGKVTGLLDSAIVDLLTQAAPGETVYVRNEEFAPSRARKRRGQALPATRPPALPFPGIGGYWALAHGRAVPVVARTPATKGGVAPKGAAPSPSGSASATGDVQPSGNAAATADVLDRPVRFVVMDERVLREIREKVPAGIADFFVSKDAPERDGASVLTLEAASPDVIEKLQKASRAMLRASDI
jgi:hypothetical protein